MCSLEGSKVELILSPITIRRKNLGWKAKFSKMPVSIGTRRINYQWCSWEFSHTSFMNYKGPVRPLLWSRTIERSLTGRLNGRTKPYLESHRLRIIVNPGKRHPKMTKRITGSVLVHIITGSSRRSPSSLLSLPRRYSDASGTNPLATNHTAAQM